MVHEGESVYPPVIILGSFTVTMIHKLGLEFAGSENGGRITRHKKYTNQIQRRKIGDGAKLSMA